MNGVYWLWIALVSLVAGAVLATIGFALRQVNRVSLEDLAGKRGRGTRVARIIQDLEGHALAVSMPRMLASLVFAVSSVYWVATLRAQAQPGWADLAGGVLGASVLLWLLGLMIPLSIARHAAASTIVRWWWLIRLVHALTLPLRRIAGLIDELARRLSGTEASSGLDQLEAQLISVVEEHERDGQVDHSARHMIERVVEFGSITVEQVMTPRTEIEALEHTDDIEVVKRFVSDAAHSRIPVYSESLDHIDGLLYAKDLLHWMAGQNGSTDKPFDLGKILRKAIFVPETKTIRELLTELLASRVHVAMVADEYGGTAGLITIEDIVEEIFGDIQDEYDIEADHPSVDINPDQLCAELDARKRIDEANDHLESIGIELPESESYDTVGGFVVVTLGLIPETGATLTTDDGLLVTVLEAEQTRVRRVRIERIDLASQSEPDAEHDHEHHAEPPTDSRSARDADLAATDPPTRD